MHELSITQNILQIALEHIDEGQQITDLYLVIGQLSSMIDESVQFYWDIISEGTAAQEAKLHFSRIPAEMQCQACGQHYRLGKDEFACPACGCTNVQLVCGDEFYLDMIEVDQVQV